MIISKVFYKLNTPTLYIKVGIFSLMIWLSLLLSSYDLHCQSNDACGTDILHTQLIRADGIYAQKKSESDILYPKRYNNWITHQNGKLKLGNSNIISIPIVFHIVHDGGVENIADDWVIGSVDYLNEVFSQLDIPIGDDVCQIQFCLAQRTPDSIISSGINRVRSSITEITYQDREDRDKLTDLISWDTREYINIWVIREIKSSGDVNPSAYAYYPFAHGQSFDGLVQEYQTLSGTDFARGTIIHEMGHYLGLHHTFYGGCKNDDCLLDGDQVCDTPPDQYRGPVCNSSQNSCNTDPNDPSDNNPHRPVTLGGLGDQPDGNNNFMDYGNHRCRNLFTAGQALRMGHFLETRRSSLLTSTGCYPPCEEDVEVAFNILSDTMYLGDGLQLNPIVNNADSLVWYIDDMYLTTSTDTLIYWDDAGPYTISLVGYSAIEGCLPDTSTHSITVLCPTESHFDLTIVEFDLSATNASVQSNSLSWTLYDDNNNLLLSTTEDSLEYQFSDWGYFRICLTAEGEHCTDELCRQIEIFELGAENCNNDRDDDGDGLIDLYDPDCPCDNESFQAQCPVDCETNTDSFVWEMEIDWVSDSISTGLVSFGRSPHFIDFDNDGIAEIYSEVAYLQDSLTPDKFIYEVGYVKIDGVLGNIIFKETQLDTGTHNRRLLENGVHQTNNSVILTPLRNLADFDQDGISEYYYGPFVYSSSPLGLNQDSGTLIAITQIGGWEKGSIAGDFLPSNPGLELATVNAVNSFEFNNFSDTTGNIVFTQNGPLNVTKGNVAAGDFDQDGLLDIVTVYSNSFNNDRDAGLWIWNPRDNTIIASGSVEVRNNGFRVGRPIIGNVDDDCYPEVILVGGSEKIIIYDIDGQTSMRLSLEIPFDDDSGGSSEISLFDFNGNGRNEIIHQGSEEINVFDGITGQSLMSFPLNHGTVGEKVTIGDVDGDGQAELLSAGFLNGDFSEGRIYCFKSKGSPWASARSTWNQEAYHVTNVKDDGSIPRYPQNSAAFFDTDSCNTFTCPQPYNNFMVQATYRDQYGCQQSNPAFDLILDIQSVVCYEEGIRLTYLISNMGDQLDFNDNVILTFYADNTLATELAKDTLSVNLSPFEISDTLDIIIPLSGVSGMLYGRVDGVDDNYILRIDDCDFENNLDSIAYSYALRNFSLGADTSMCSESILVLDAPLGFSSYFWSDGTNEPSYTASYFGTHTLEVTDDCGRFYRDSIVISEKDPLTVDIPNDTIACTNQEILIEGDFDVEHISWFPISIVDCIDCERVVATVDTSQYLYVTGRTEDCFTVDSIFIEVRNSITIDSSSSICYGEIVSFFNELLDSSGLYTYEIGNCDTIYTLDLDVKLRPDTICNDVTLCFGDSILFNNIWIKEDAINFYSEQSTIGCDSIYHELRTTVSSDTKFSFQDSLLCFGDSLYFDNMWLTESGRYSELLQNSNGCDSLEINLELIVVESPEVQVLDTLLCHGDSILLFNTLIIENTVFDTIIFDDLKQECEVIDFSADVKFLSAPEIAVLDTVICDGQSVVFNNQQIDTSAEFSNIILNQIGCDSIVENIKIRVLPAPIIQNIDTVLCHDQNMEFNGQLIASDTVLQSKILNYLACDSIVTNISIELLPSPIENIIDTFVCEIDLPIVLQQRDTLPNYLGCDSLYTEMNYQSHEPLEIELTNEITGTYGEEFVINFDANKSLDIIEWNGQNLSCLDCNSPTITVLENDTLSLFVQDEDGCDTTLQVRVVLSEAEPEITDGIYIPNIINSNSQSLNCCFYLQSNQNEEVNYDLAIFDRWGNVVFQRQDLVSNKMEEGWDGTINGNFLEQGIYVYRILVRSSDGDESYFGDITLLR